nr:retrovirus-related Pol polyprotein from transposon TNT 1-94 [Tanacetum cinerariifolium]
MSLLELEIPLNHPKILKLNPYSTTSPKKPSRSLSKLKGNVLDLSTPLSKRKTRLRRGVLTESSQYNEYSIEVKCNTYGSTIHSTPDHNDFDHFKKETHQGAYMVPGQWMLEKYDWCQELSTQICRATRNSYVSKAFRVYNTRRKQIEETYHVTFNENMEAIRHAYKKHGFQAYSSSASECIFADFLSEIKPKKVSEALKHPGSKWVFMNKKDEHGTTTKNIARMVAQGYSQEEGTEYDETFVLEARMEAIRIFLAFAIYMNFKVYQMDVKSAFLNGKLKEEVYVKQPPGFESSEFPNYIYMLNKALISKDIQTRTMLAVTWIKKHFRCCASILWMKSQLSDYGIHYKMVSIFCDKANAIAITNNPVLHSRTKHIDIRYHFIRDHILNGDIELHFTPAEYQLAVLGRNYSFTEQVNSIYQLLAYSLIIGTEVDTGVIIYSDLLTKLLNKIKSLGFYTPIQSNSHFIKDPFKVIGVLFKKSKRPNSKKSPIEAMVTLPKPTEDSEQSYSVSSGTVPDPQDLYRDIQLASMGFPSTLDEGTRKSQPFPESTSTHPKDSGGNKQPLDRDITSMTHDEGTTKNMLRPEGSLRDKDSLGNIPPTDMEPIHNLVVDLLRIGAKYQVDETQSTRLSNEEEVIDVGDDMDEDPQDDAEVRSPSPNQTQRKPSQVQESASDTSTPDLKRFDNTLPLTERKLINSFIRDLYKGLNAITELLKDINSAVKDDPATNKKIDEAIMTFAKISTQTTEILSLKEASAAWTKSSTNMAWNLGSRMTVVGISQTALKHKVSSLSQDTLEIKSIMLEIYQAFKGQPSLAPSGSVTPTLALTYIPANVKGENTTNTATEEPPSHTEGETEDATMETLIS